MDLVNPTGAPNTFEWAICLRVDNPSLAEMGCPVDLREPSIAGESQTVAC